MIVIKTIFAVIDPTTENQRALDRAVRIARIRHAKIHVYASIYSRIENADQEELCKAETARYQLWLDGIVAPLIEEGLDVTIQIEWNKDWFFAIAPAAKKANSDLIVKPSRAHSTAERMFMKTSDLALFKTAQCPVLLIKSDVANSSHKVLISFDAHRDDEKYGKLSEKIVEYGKSASEPYEDGELHVVHAYTNQDEYVHVTDLQKRASLDTEHVHIVGDDPEQAIAKVAKDINAQIIVIGLSTKGTFRNRVFGSTGEWLLNNLDNDLLVVFPEE